MSKNTVLVIAAHPDDEILGCGATMAVHNRSGDKVYSLILSQGIKSRIKDFKNSTKIKNLQKSLAKANKTVGVKKFFTEDFPDNAFDTVPLLQIVQKIEKIVQITKPNIIYTHHHSDLNLDHGITNRATIIATRPFPKSKINKILTYEVNSSTECSNINSNGNFHPNYFVYFNNSILRKKIKALNYYGSEMRPWPHPRSIKAIEVLAKRRGSMVGLSMAESFCLFRYIQK